ncbi:DUF916 domain-containing protein, partial [Candidatus Peregrinibacteria bacterium]|nr:DUF916 domain-containing protein [Candidatus Peregrinibacteria bacterium]
MFNKIKFLPLLIVTLLVLQGTALAIEYEGVGASPAYPRENNERSQSIFIHSLEQGDLVEEGVKVVNNTEEVKTLMVYSADSTPSTDGGFACEQYSETKDQVGSWMDLSTEITLEPNSEEVVSFSIRVPDGTSVGEHDGCVVVQEKETAPQTAGSTINLATRVALRVAITVPGPEVFEKVAIAQTGVERNPEGGKALSVQVENMGNVAVDANIKIMVQNLFGMNVKTYGGIYPVLSNDKTVLNFDFKPTFWGGFYKADYKVEYHDKELDGASKWFFVTPSLYGI